MSQIVGQFLHEFEANTLAELAWFRIGARALQALRLLRKPSIALLLAKAFHQGKASAGISTSATLVTQMSPTAASGTRAISAMDRAELRMELIACAVDVQGATVAQMRETLRQLRGEDFRKRSVQGLSAMKKPELMTQAEALGVDPTGKTAVQLRLAIQGWDAAAAAASGKVASPATRVTGTDKVTFGQYKGEMYANILKNRPSYAAWVVAKGASKDSSPALQRLSGYLEANGVVCVMEVGSGADVEILEPSDYEILSTSATRTQDEPDDFCAMFL
jgi:hypothetical protein